MNLTDAQKTLPIVKRIRAALPTINYAFHTVCSKYTFGDICIDSVESDLVVLTCTVRDTVDPIRMVFDGHTIHFSSINYGWPMLFPSESNATLVKLRAKAAGIAIAYVIKSISLYNYAVDFHRFRSLNNWVVEPFVGRMTSVSNENFGKIALNETMTQSIVFTRNTLEFSSWANNRKAISLECNDLTNISLADYRKMIREAFDFEIH